MAARAGHTTGLSTAPLRRRWVPAMSQFDTAHMPELLTDPPTSSYLHSRRAATTAPRDCECGRQPRQLGATSSNATLQGPNMGILGFP